MSKQEAKFLTVYESACRAITTVVLAKEWRDKSIALGVFARLAKNKELEIDAGIVRCRSERRLGQIIVLQKTTVGLNKGAAATGVGKRGAKAEPRSDEPPTLAEAGIDKKLSSAAQAMAAVPEDEFESLIAKRKPKAVMHAAKRQIRQTKHKDIARKAKLVSHDARKFNLIYADPPWKFETFAESGQARTAEKHYPTMPDTEIAAFKYGERLVSEIVARDALLFMWCTPANLVRALAILPAWGFTYRTHMVWVKDKAGTGLYARQQHEPLIIAARGKPPRPEFSPSSVIMAPRGRHSAKPIEAREIIEKMYPHWDETNRIEFFSREPAPGWTVYGYEAVP